MYIVSPISSRNQFGKLLLDHGLTDAAVEVGVHRGEFARVLLDNWPGRLVCVDPWDDNLPGYEDQSQTLWGDASSRQEDYDATIATLYKDWHRVVVMRCTSMQAVQKFADASLDFVYLDGDHTRPAIDKDLARWWSKIKSGGILAGHDIVCPGEVNGGWGMYIQPAVHEFATMLGVEVYYVVEEGGLPWSFYVIKP